MKIKKGDQFECLKDFTFEGCGRFLKGAVYRSTMDGRIVDYSGNQVYIGELLPPMKEYFKRRNREIVLKKGDKYCCFVGMLPFFYPLVTYVCNQDGYLSGVEIDSKDGKKFFRHFEKVDPVKEVINRLITHAETLLKNEVRYPPGGSQNNPIKEGKFPENFPNEPAAKITPCANVWPNMDGIGYPAEPVYKEITKGEAVTYVNEGPLKPLIPADIEKKYTEQDLVDFASGWAFPAHMEELKKYFKNWNDQKNKKSETK